MKTVDVKGSVQRSRWILPLIPVVTLLTVATASPQAPDDTETIEHALSRLTFGVRAEDVEKVRGIGLARWIDQQLSPSREDAAALAGRLPTPAPVPATFASPQDARRFGRQQVDVLASAKVLRAVYSERQLEELLVDFWFNHFNVFAGKGRTALFVPEYERDAIRPHVYGRFRDLLGATAKSPAMLFYLDNWQSSAADAPIRGNRPQGPRGLNENYGRELLELHTLGVDGGYEESDVREVARAFTGWTIDLRANSFRFVPARHDRGMKRVLGQTIPAGGGIEDGERVLDMLAQHPATARHIAEKLARRFVSDQPPPELVARAAARFSDTDGDLREVVRVIVTSPEFFSAATRRAKVKTPFEFVVSALRAAGVDVANAAPTLRTLREMGMSPYMCQPPTGYDDTADTWLSSGALVARMNFATGLASGKVRGLSPPAGQDPTTLAVRLGSPAFQQR